MVFGQGKEGAAPEPVIYFRPGLLIAVTLITILVVGLGSLWKTLALRAGGRTVAESLDGQLLSPGSGDIAERRLLNVVEEMAIASGTPVPPVYVMQEEMGINAFAAGFGPDDAVIGVTRGCMEKLTRDQLQGVIAHEFSHILNGDMRLNIRLMGILHGILVIGLIGGVLLRVGSYSSMSRRRSKDNGGAKIALVGLAIFIIGYVGFFFGKLIKAAVSRQREYLADASAVQFTRNPDGIAGALKAIGGYAGHGTLQSSQAESCSHMFFSHGKKKSFIEFNSLATHPPLHDRIQRIDPSFDGSFPEIDEDHSGVGDSEKSVGFAGSKKRSRSVSPPQPKAAAVTPEQLTASIGTIDPSRLSYARELVAGLPEALRDAAREPYSARALVYALLLDTDHEVRSKQLDHLAVSAEEGMHAATQELQQVLSQVGRSARLPLADLAMPALRQLAEERGVAHCGADGKTGETLVKTVLAPMFAARGLKVHAWQGYNMLGNRDGEVLRDPNHAAAKIQHKDDVLRGILGADSGHHSKVRIDYVPSLGDWKTAMDFIHFEGFLGARMSLQFTWAGCDSALAAPLVFDLVRLAHLSAERGEGGVMEHTACFFKAPLSGGSHDFHDQHLRLLAYAASCQR